MVNDLLSMGFKLVFMAQVSSFCLPGTFVNISRVIHCTFCSKNAVVLRDMLIANARLVRDDLLRHVLDVNSQFLILAITVCQRSGELLPVRVDLVDRLVKLVEVFVLLLAEAVQPHVFIVLIISYEVGVAATEVLSLQFHRSLDSDLLHTTIFRLSIDI